MVNKERALAEVQSADYSTTTEIADALMQKGRRAVSHRPSFRLETHRLRRGHGLKLGDIPYAQAARIYQEQTQQALPLDEPAFREVISAEYMVFGRKGTGGPQLGEVRRMLSEAMENVAADFVWLKNSTGHLARADASLDQAFNALLDL